MDSWIYDLLGQKQYSEGKYGNHERSIGRTAEGLPRAG
jgi:hypothetical protein